MSGGGVQFSVPAGSVQRADEEFAMSGFLPAEWQVADASRVRDYFGTFDDPAERARTAWCVLVGKAVLDEGLRKQLVEAMAAVGFKPGDVDTAADGDGRAA